MQYQRSSTLFQEAQAVIPGGVNSPVRAFKSVGGTPLFVKRASGAYLYDEDGNQLIDYISSWGPMILGHGNEEVNEATQIIEQLESGVLQEIPNIVKGEAKRYGRMAPVFDEAGKVIN